MSFLTRITGNFYFRKLVNYTFPICKHNLHNIYRRPKNGGAIRVMFLLGHPVYKIYSTLESGPSQVDSRQYNLGTINHGIAAIVARISTKSKYSRLDIMDKT